MGCVSRWLGYLGLLLFDVLICLLVLFGLIRNSRSTLIGYGAPLRSSPVSSVSAAEFQPMFLFVLQRLSAGGSDSHHQLGVSRPGTRGRCCTCRHGNTAEAFSLCSDVIPTQLQLVCSVWVLS